MARNQVENVDKVENVITWTGSSGTAILGCSCVALPFCPRDPGQVALQLESPGWWFRRESNTYPLCPVEFVKLKKSCRMCENE